MSSWENVVCECLPCYVKKGNKLLSETGIQLRRQPVRPKWHPLHRLQGRTFPELWRFVGADADTAVTVEVAHSGDIAATSPTVTLTVPSGYTIASGTNPQTLSGIDPDSAGTATWTVHSPAATTTSTVTFSVDASTTSYGETSAAEKIV